MKTFLFVIFLLLISPPIASEAESVLICDAVSSRIYSSPKFLDLEG